MCVRIKIQKSPNSIELCSWLILCGIDIVYLLRQGYHLEMDMSVHGMEQEISSIAVSPRKITVENWKGKTFELYQNRGEKGLLYLNV